MFEVTKQAIASQFEAAFLTLQKGIDQCPDESWHQPVANNPFSQTVFHALFFGDLYLGETIESMKEQGFHLDHADVFAGYEELNHHEESVKTYPRSFIQSYLDFCRSKAKAEIAAETEASLNAQVNSPWHTFSRLEMHIYNIRHLQHHAAQLILRLRINHNPEIDWVRNGYDHLRNA